MIEFETDHQQYMSLGDIKLPLALELRAKAALVELKDIQEEFELFVTEHEREARLREEHFHDAMSHYQGTKGEWVRVEDELGNVHWVKESLVEEKLPTWLDDIMPPPKTDLLNWGSV